MNDVSLAPCMQGQKAVKTGKMLEGMIKSMLVEAKYKSMPDIEVAESMLSLGLKNKWFCPQYNRLKGIYGVSLRIDFMLVNPDTFPNGLAIEVKFQRTAGSVDEKYPYVILNMRHVYETYKVNSVLFLEGGGYRPCSLAWCKGQTTKDFQVVEGIPNIVNWIINNLA
jgi:hypothetical protein